MVACRRLNLYSIQPAVEREEECIWIKTRLMYEKSCSSFWVEDRGKMQAINLQTLQLSCAANLKWITILSVPKSLCTHSFKCIHEHVSITFVWKHNLFLFIKFSVLLNAFFTLYFMIQVKFQVFTRWISRCIYQT